MTDWGMHTHWAFTITMLELTAMVFVPYLVTTCVYVLATTARAERVSMLTWSVGIGILAFMAFIVVCLLLAFLGNLVPWWLYCLAEVVGFLVALIVGTCLYLFGLPPDRIVIAVFKWTFAVLAGVGCIVFALGFASDRAMWLTVIILGVGLALVLTAGAEAVRAAVYDSISPKRRNEQQ